MLLLSLSAASKERDLILAAELGKALLEKNEELRNVQKTSHNLLCKVHNSCQAAQN